MVKKSRLCFLIGPIGAHGSAERRHADELLLKIIKPTFRASFKDLQVERADQIAAPGMMNTQIINRLLDAELVIADLTHKNANAFYELGIRHMRALPVVHVFQRGSIIPADVAPYRALEFDYSTPTEVTAAKKALRLMVQDALAPHHEVETPVTRAPSYLKLYRQTEPKKQRFKRLRRINIPPITIQGPGLAWRANGKNYAVMWLAPQDARAKGFEPARVRLWAGSLKELEENKYTKEFISDRANALQGEALRFLTGDT